MNISFNRLFLNSMLQDPFNTELRRLHIGFYSPPMIIRCVLFLLLFIIPLSFAYADDPGITKVRLIQLSDTSYMLEADVPQALLWSIKKPILPERFHFIEFNSEDQSGWITQRATFTTSGSPLSPEDEIILPWTRNGVDFTVQWIDGTIHKKLFYRTLGGIHVLMTELLPKIRTTTDVVQESFLLGINHLKFLWIHFFLILILFWANPSFKSIRHLLWFSFGQAFAVILADVNVQGFDLLFCEMLLMLLVLVYAYSIAYHKEFRFISLVLFVVGVMHSLSFAHDLQIMKLASIQKIQAMFAFNFSIDFYHYLLSLILILVLPTIQKKKVLKRSIPIAVGSVSVFMLMLVFQENIKKGNTQIPGLNETNKNVDINSASFQKPSNPQISRGTGKMNTPIMTFLSIEPFEIRQEILIKADVAMQAIGEEDRSLLSIPIESQDELKLKLEELLLTNCTIRIDGKIGIPTNKNSDFVTMGQGGVSIRSTPVEENLETGIIGISYTYDTRMLPDSITLDWRFFPNSAKLVEASAVDPHGAFTVELSPNENKLKWKSRLKGYQTPVIESVNVEKKSYPVPSIIIWIIGWLYMLIYSSKSKPSYHKYWIVSLLIVGFVFYPFYRTKFSISFLPQEKPSRERSQIIINDLLTNVYRSFDRKKEAEVYDRLALSVQGDQLTDIYLQNRKAMVLENRGGAKASVEEVKVYEIYDIYSAKNGTFVGDASWAVTGSVNHFGHTHYRQNKYRAFVTFIQEQDIWKISNIEAIDEQRIY